MERLQHGAQLISFAMSIMKVSFYLEFRLELFS